MASLQTRAFIHAGGDFYLCPLPAVQLPDDVLEAYLEPQRRIETNRVYQIDHKIPGKLLKNERIMSERDRAIQRLVDEWKGEVEPVKAV